MLRTKLKTTKMAVTVALLAGGMMVGLGATAQAATLPLTGTYTILPSSTMCMAGTTSCSGSPPTGSIDFDTGVIAFNPNTFSGQPWTMHNTSIQQTPGTNTFGAMTYTVGTGQIGSHALMDWAGLFLNMDVGNVWNVTDLGGGQLELSPGATGPGTNLGGVTMVNGFTGQTPLIDLHIQAPAPVPVPAAAWLFGSGLLGLVGMARRKKANA